MMNWPFDKSEKDFCWVLQDKILTGVFERQKRVRRESVRKKEGEKEK